jgi:hypothetical protein
MSNDSWLKNGRHFNEHLSPTAEADPDVWTEMVLAMLAIFNEVTWQKASEDFINCSNRESISSQFIKLLHSHCYDIISIIKY